MSITIHVHASRGQNLATVQSYDETYWLTIQSDGNDIAIFGKPEHAPALQMMADIFNDTFGPKEVNQSIAEVVADDLVSA